MAQIEAEKSKVPQRPPRRPKVPKRPKILTAILTPIVQPPPNRNPFSPPIPPIFRQRKYNGSCCSYLYTNEGIEWNGKQLPVCFVKPTPRAPPTPTQSPVPTLPNSPLTTRPSTPEIQSLVNDFFSSEPNSRQESPVPPEDVEFVLDNLYEQQANRHPEANLPFLFLNPIEVAPEADLPEDIWDLLENPGEKMVLIKT